jgi:hypothetical protein
MVATEDEDEVPPLKVSGASKMLYRGPPTSTRSPRVKLWVGADYTSLTYCYSVL